MLQNEDEIYEKNPSIFIPFFQKFLEQTKNTENPKKYIKLK
jgi:hypothetical protein